MSKSADARVDIVGSHVACDAAVWPCAARTDARGRQRHRHRSWQSVCTQFYIQQRPAGARCWGRHVAGPARAVHEEGKRGLPDWHLHAQSGRFKCCGCGTAKGQLQQQLWMFERTAQRKAGQKMGVQELPMYARLCHDCSRQPRCYNLQHCPAACSRRLLPWPVVCHAQQGHPPFQIANLHNPPSTPLPTCQDAHCLGMSLFIICAAFSFPDPASRSNALHAG